MDGVYSKAEKITFQGGIFAKKMLQCPLISKWLRTQRRATKISKIACLSFLKFLGSASIRSAADLHLSNPAPQGRSQHIKKW
jgi:hypothetical protein